ncbi:MAG: oligopeptide/dipeptide ABC transporter ATP-binding protein, partial [Betaproteobacteria bacterium]
ISIAMALALQPQLLIADEPVTALDVIVQRQILDLIVELRQRLGLSMIMVTHAVSVVAYVCDSVVVMYAGQVVEEAPVQALFAQPRHPYTRGLIRSIPRIGSSALPHKVRLEAIPGSVPKLIEPGPGCRFASRCPHARAECSAATPELRELSPGHRVACVLDEVVQ